MFRDLGYDARVAYERGQPGAGALEVRGGGLSRPIRFSGEMVMLSTWAQQHAKLLDLVRQLRGQMVARRRLL